MSLVQRSNRALQIAIWGTAFVLLLLAAYAIRSLTLQRVDVVAATASYQDVAKTLSTIGKVEPINDFRVYAPSPGQIQNVYVKVGDKVKPGQLLLNMDDTDVRSSVANAQSVLQSATLAASDIQLGGSQEEREIFTSDLDKNNLQRQHDAADLAAREKLLQQGAESPAGVAEAKHRVVMDDADIASIKERIDQRYRPGDVTRAAAAVDAARAGVEAARKGFDKVDFRSKIAGTVYWLPVSRYDYVKDPGVDLVFVADLSRMRITAYFEEPDIGNLAVDQQVTITWESSPGVVWHGHISQVPTTVIEYQQRFVGECVIIVDDADGTLEPNADVNVHVTTAQGHHVVTVPHQAVQHDSRGFFVYRIANNKLVRTPVEVGIENVNQAEIKSGLSVGDLVAVHATTNRDLTDGLPVTPAQ